MFDSGVELPAVPTAQLAGLIEQNHADLVSAECRMLQLAARGLTHTTWTRVVRSISR